MREHAHPTVIKDERLMQCQILDTGASSRMLLLYSGTLNFSIGLGERKQQ